MAFFQGNLFRKMLVVFVVDNERSAMHSQNFPVSPNNPNIQQTSASASISWMEAAKWAVELTCRSLMRRRESVDRSLAQMQFSLFLTAPIGSPPNPSVSASSNNFGCFCGAASAASGSHLMTVDDFVRMVKSLPCRSSSSGPSLTQAATGSAGGMGRCLTEVFEYIHSLQFSRYDTSSRQGGEGMWIPLNDPVIVMCISCDGLAVRRPDNSGTGLTVGGLRVPGSESYREPFRWNQRLFCLVLSHTDYDNHTNSFHSEEGILFWLDKMTRVMAGGWKRVTGLYDMKFAVESWCSSLPAAAAAPAKPLVQSSDFDYAEETINTFVDPVDVATFFPSGVVVSFSSVLGGANQQPLFREHLCLIQTDPIDAQFIDRNLNTVMARGSWLSLIPDNAKLFGYWPIPESACSPQPATSNSSAKGREPAVDDATANIPRLFSQPRLCVWPNESGIDYSINVPEGIALKKYLINPHSECARFIMRPENRSHIWLVSAASYPAAGSPALPTRSSAGGIQGGHEPPFALLKLNSAANGVNLWLLPYNFPELFAIISEWIRARGQLSNEWRRRYETYFAALPQYYFGVMRRLVKLKCQPLFPVPKDKVPALIAGNDPALAHARWVREMSVTHASKYTISYSVSALLAGSGVIQGGFFDKIVDNAFNVRSVDLMKQHYMRLQLFGNVVPVRPVTCNGPPKCGSIEKNAPITKFGYPLFGYGYGVSQPATSSLNEMIASWNIPEVRRRDAWNRLAPRTPSQAVQDAKHEVSFEKMGDYKPRLQTKRFLSDEEEKRDKLLAFGNPYKRIVDPQFTRPTSPPAARIQSTNEPNGNPVAPTDLSPIAESVEHEHFMTSAAISPSKHSHTAGKVFIESISEKRPSSRFRVSLDAVFSKPFDPAFVKSVEVREKFVQEAIRTFDQVNIAPISPTTPVSASYLSSKRQFDGSEFSSCKKKKPAARMSPWLEDLQISEAITSDKDIFEIASSESLGCFNQHVSGGISTSMPGVSLLDNSDSEEEADLHQPSVVKHPGAPQLSVPIQFDMIQKNLLSLIRRAGSANNDEILAQVTRNDLSPEQRRLLRALAIVECHKFKKSYLLKILENN